MESGITKLEQSQVSVILSTQGSVVLQEQKDKAITIELIAMMLKRLALLYQVPNFDNENAVLLSQWIMSTYKFETLEVIVECLESPPKTGEKNWRLTPDTIESWFAIKLEEIVKRKEREYEKEKLRIKEEESQRPPNIPNFSEMFKGTGTWFEKAEREESNADYEKFKQNYLNSKKDEQD